MLKKEIIDALTTRWIASDGLEVHQVRVGGRGLCLWRAVVQEASTSS